MESIFATATAWAPRVLSILRIVAGLAFLQHGTMKYFNIPANDMFTDLPVMSIFGIGGILELVGGALIVVGLFTRPVAFVLSGMMAVAYFMFHAPSGFFPALNQGEAALLYCFIFLYLACAGGGAWSVDAKRGKA
jgi:putative oxidoreductase